MAFLLEHARWDAERVPVPAPPRLARASLRRARQRLTVVAVLWLVVGAAFGFATPFDHDTVGVVRYSVVMIGCLQAVLHGVFAMDGTGADLARVFGYGRRGMSDLVRPVGTIATCMATALGGFGLGLVAGVGIRVVRGEPYLLLAAALPVDVAMFWWAYTRARRAWLAQRRDRVARERILAEGEHVVARVGSIRAQGSWIGGRAAFLMDLDFTHRGEQATRQLLLHEYPMWAPEEGNQFDLWLDRDGRAVVERRYVDQRFAPEPERFRRPGAGDGPAWLVRPAPGRRPGLWTGVWPTLAALLAVFAVAVVPLADVPWWTVAALAVHGALAVVNAVVAWRFVRLGRGFVHRGHTFYGTGVRCYVGLIVMTAGVLDLLWRPLTGATPWTHGHLVAGFALCGWLLLYWLPVLDQLAYRANHPAPPDLIQEALTTHDDHRMDALEADHGHTVGVCLLPSRGAGQAG